MGGSPQNSNATNSTNPSQADGRFSLSSTPQTNQISGIEQAIRPAEKAVQGLSTGLNRWDKDLTSPLFPLPSAPQMQSPAAQTAAGIYNAIIKPTAEFAQSPVGIASAGIGGLGSIPARLVKAAFIPSMVKGAYESGKETIDKINDPKSSIQDIVTSASSALGQAAGGLGAYHGAVSSGAGKYLPSMGEAGMVDVRRGGKKLATQPTPTSTISIPTGISPVSDEHNYLRVGTAKLGTKKKPIDTPQTSNIGGEIVPEDILKRQMGSFNYDHLPNDIKRLRNPQNKRRAIIDWMKENLRSLHDAYSPDVRERATRWYDGARKIADRFAEKHGVDPHQAAGVLAVFSPQKDWFMNVAQGDQMMDVWKNHQDTKITPEKYGDEIKQIIDVAQATADQKYKTKGMQGNELEMARAYNKQLDLDAKENRAKVLNTLYGKSIKELDNFPELQAWAIRVLAQVEHGRNYNNLSPEGEMLDLAKNKPKKEGQEGELSKNGWGSTGEIMKAVQIIKNGDLKNISEQLGDEHKVRNFYNNIIAPNSPFGDATIDTHAVAAAHLMPYGSSAQPVLHNFGGKGMGGSGKQGISGSYHLYLDAYKELAKELGLQPRQLQSITWEAIRSLFPSEERSAKAINDTKAIWKNNDNETARNTILGRGIPNPVWHRPNYAK
jgi:hypothetical protein